MRRLEDLELEEVENEEEVQVEESIAIEHEALKTYFDNMIKAVEDNDSETFLSYQDETNELFYSEQELWIEGLHQKKTEGWDVSVIVNNITLETLEDDKHNTSQLLFGEPPEVIEMRRTSDGFYLLQRIQDEVHRFAITFLRQQQQSHAIASVLDEIEGVGPKRKQQLLKHFGSVKKIREATVDQLIEASMPSSLAILINEYFQKDTLKKQ